MDKLAEELEIVVHREMEIKEDVSNSNNSSHVEADHVHDVQLEVISKMLDPQR